MLEIKPYRRLFGLCEHMRKRSQDPSQINPLQTPLQLCPANSVLLALKHSRRAISAHTVRTGPLPRCTHTHTNIVGVAKTDGQCSPSQPFVRCESLTEAGELHVCMCGPVKEEDDLGVSVCNCMCVCAHIPVDGGKESMAFDLLHSIGPGP